MAGKTTAYEVRDPEIEQMLKEIGRTVGNVLPEGWGFALMIFSFGEGGSTFYISNARREDMITALEEFRHRLLSGKG